MAATKQIESEVEFTVTHNPIANRILDAAKERNIGQTYKDVPKYSSVVDDRFYTGAGSAFEDLDADRRRSAGQCVEKTAASYHSPDFTIDGVPTQYKARKEGCNGKRKAARGIAESLYENADVSNGQYKYKGQQLCVPKGYGDLVKNELEKQGRKCDGVDGPEEILESEITYKDAELATFRGKESRKMDLKQPWVYGEALKGGAIAFATLTAAGTVIYWFVQKKRHKKVSWKGVVAIAFASAIASGAIAGVGLKVGLDRLQEPRPTRKISNI